VGTACDMHRTDAPVLTQPGLDSGLLKPKLDYGLLVALEWLREWRQYHIMIKNELSASDSNFDW